ncbi:MAG TPA: putative glycolipid-binding domain-containing protein [Micromonosporaceae bacterium]|nr:putative glycolipid-binding domain-containing protein [Micromonosporaceae bacterium]
MPTLPKSLLWVRTDSPGTDHALFDDSHGLLAHGTAQAAIPVPYTCRYELTTDETWAAKRLVVSVEGAGWLRSVRLESSGGQWRVSTAEEGDLDAALAAARQPPVGLPGTEDPGRLDDAVDVDLGAAPLFNALPVRRLGLQDAPPGTSHTLKVVWVLVPSLLVVPAEQTYTALEGGNVHYASEGFSADLQLDADGYVLNYPGLAQRG